MGREFADAILGTRQRNQDALEWEIVCWLHSGKVICACFDTVPVDLFRVAVALPAALLAVKCVSSASLIGMPSFEFTAGNGVVRKQGHFAKNDSLLVGNTFPKPNECSAGAAFVRHTIV